MKTCCCRQRSVAVLLAFALASLLYPAGAAFAGGPAPAPDWTRDQALAEMYAPVLYFHPDELFRPQPVDVLLGTARLQQARSFLPDVRLLRQVTSSDLQHYAGDSYYLNVWLGDEASSDYKNYTSHRAYYRSTLSPEAGGPSPVTYARVVRSDVAQEITIQYWLFYWYNDAFNKHEGDWEMVQVVLAAEGEPEWIVLSQHHGGTRRPWRAAQIEGGTHPAVHVALGSHANYFWGDEIYISGMALGNARVEVADRTGTAGRTLPGVILIPGRDELAADPARWVGLEWLQFGGCWGERAPQRDLSGPLGPADKGDQWDQPLAWGLGQPLDVDTWYANRLRVEVVGQQGDSARVTLRAAGMHGLALSETLDGLALLHADPGPATTILAGIEARPGGRYDIVATWPDATASRVIQYRFKDVSLGAEGNAVLTLRAGEPPVLSISGNPQPLRPTTMVSATATWDAPDVVWALGLLPVSDLLGGVLLSLLAGLLPALLYVAGLYWADQYEKEPVRLLAAAFGWGAVPALLVAVAVRIFFRLPAGLLPPETIEAINTAFVAPLVEQALAGAAVLYVALRHRREFDGVLDGILYGAVTGLGFAMAGNTVSYLSSLMRYGFAGLGHTVLVDGMLYGLNQALYASIWGAGLGYAGLAQRRWQRWAVPLAAFVLAVATHAFHNLALDSTLGWNLRTVAVTWAGVLVIVAVMAWSLRQQRCCLAAELVGEVPAALYGWLALPGGCWLVEWRALWRGGLRGLVQMRRTLQLCSRLALKKGASRQPGETGTAAEVHHLREQLQPLLTGADALASQRRKRCVNMASSPPTSRG